MEDDLRLSLRVQAKCVWPPAALQPAACSAVTLAPCISRTGTPRCVMTSIDGETVQAAHGANGRQCRCDYVVVQLMLHVEVEVDGKIEG